MPPIWVRFWAPNSLSKGPFFGRFSINKGGLSGNWRKMAENKWFSARTGVQFLLEGAKGKPNDELSDPEPWRGSRGTPLEKFESTLFKLA